MSKIINNKKFRLVVTICFINERAVSLIVCKLLLHLVTKEYEEIPDTNCNLFSTSFTSASFK